MELNLFFSLHLVKIKNFKYFHRYQLVLPPHVHVDDGDDVNDDDADTDAYADADGEVMMMMLMLMLMLMAMVTKTIMVMCDVLNLSTGVDCIKYAKDCIPTLNSCLPFEQSSDNVKMMKLQFN